MAFGKPEIIRFASVRPFSLSRSIVSRNRLSSQGIRAAAGDDVLHAKLANPAGRCGRFLTRAAHCRSGFEADLRGVLAFEA